MEQLQSGNIVTLTITDEEGSRWILDGQDEEIFINKSEADDTLQIGDEVEVFLYVNRRKQLAATMRIPNMTIGTFGWAKVIRVEPREGVYVDIGSSFEVLVNGADLPHIPKLWPIVGDELYMTLRADLGGNIFGRLATEERVLEVVNDADSALFNANLKARAYRLLPVGTFLLTVPDNYRIFVHESERQAEPRLGQEVDVRVIDVHRDGTLNGSMLPRVEERLTGDAEVIYTYLTDIGGKMPFTDKSSPEEIKEMFNLSKGAFKRALGRLMRERRVIQEDGWTKIVENQ